MTEYDRRLKLEMAATPMPEPYSSWVCEIDCNECGSKSVVPFHILGHFCSSCGSSNTAVLSKRERAEDDPPAPSTDLRQLLSQAGVPDELLDEAMNQINNGGAIEVEDGEEGGSEEEGSDDENGNGESEEDDDDDSDDDGNEEEDDGNPTNPPNEGGEGAGDAHPTNPPSEN